MEWIKSILESAVMGEDGKLDVDATLKIITTEFPKHAVPKQDYNDKVKDLNTATNTIATLKKENEDNEGLQTKISDYETEIDTLKKEREGFKKQTALESALQKMDCADPDYLIFKHGGVEKFSFGEDGTPIGLEDIVKPYKESNKVLFPTGQKETKYEPVGGSGGGTSNPFAKETWNLTEQGKLYREDPAGAKMLAQAAGKNI